MEVYIVVGLKELNKELRKILNEELIMLGKNPDNFPSISWEESKKLLQELIINYKMEV